MTEATLTRIGGPTMLIEYSGWRILTDPTFDPPGRRYGFGWGTSSSKTEGPAVSPADLGRIDAVLLSHDQHADNLDDAGRALLAGVPIVVTTGPAAKRLGDSARGLTAGQTTRLEYPGRPTLVVTATPARHGPPLTRPIVGAALGFAIAIDGADRAAIWMSGDTVSYGTLRRTARELSVDVAILHLGSVRFRSTGPLRFTMGARDAVPIIEDLEPRIVVPVHCDGWSHFTESEASARDAFAAAPVAVQERLRWLEHGVPTTV